LRKEISHCPFCNSKKCYADLLIGSNRLYSVKCPCCGAIGPHFEEWDNRTIGKENAIKLWNKRYNE